VIAVGEAAPRALADAVVLDRASREKKLGAFWTDAPAILLFLRHFGCIGCAQQVTELSPRLDELQAAGVRTVLVGNGAPEMIDAFVERHALGDKKCEIVTDPSLAAFRAAGLVRSAWSTIGFRAIVDAARALAEGHRQPRIEGDRWQQGGALLCDAGGRVVLYHRNVSIGDHVPAADLVDAALALLVRKSKTHV
jgi:peroxiredoxin